MVTTHLALYFFNGMGGAPVAIPSINGFTTAGPLWAWDGYTAGTAPIVEVEIPRFGGGPFWRQYGYDKAWDATRESASTETLQALQPPGFDEVERVPFTDYRAVESRVAEKIATEMRAREKRKKTQEEEDLMIALLYLDESDPQD